MAEKLLKPAELRLSGEVLGSVPCATVGIEVDGPLASISLQGDS